MQSLQLSNTAALKRACMRGTGCRLFPTAPWQRALAVLRLVAPHHMLEDQHLAVRVAPPLVGR